MHSEPQTTLFHYFWNTSQDKQETESSFYATTYSLQEEISSVSDVEVKTKESKTFIETCKELQGKDINMPVLKNSQ